MSFLIYVKNNLTRLPYPIGSLISKVPYRYRPGMGRVYNEKYLSALNENDLPTNKIKEIVFHRVKEISTYAYKNIPFYMDLYKGCNVNPSKMSNFSDIYELPVVSKRDFLAVDIEYRSSIKNKRSLVNTGGSSGNPLGFYIEPSSIPHEWGHMHVVWNKLGFTSSKLRLVFGGRSDVNDIYTYDSARHQININIYSGWKVIADELLKGNITPDYLHGYPSAIFDFVIWLDTTNHQYLRVLKNTVRGIFLGSEFPSPILRNYTEKILCCESVSWYGHTERAVLAYEKNKKYEYVPFFSYGFSEAVEISGEMNLISTSYYNKASPLIRYNTEDIIKPCNEDGLMKSFSISQGRNGDYVFDRHKNKIYLTALIYGRHHKIFDYISNIQVRQDHHGIVDILYVPRFNADKFDAKKFFDSSNVEIDFNFISISEPLKTVSGKVQLLIK